MAQRTRNDTQITCPNCGTEIPVSQALSARVRADLEAQLRRESDARLSRAVADAEARTRETFELDLADLRSRLATQQAKLQTAQEAELRLRQEKADLDARQRELDLEVARRLEEQKAKLEEGIRKHVGEEQALELREKDKQIDDLRQALDDAKRRSELGSQQLQGEVLELDIQAALEQQFPFDIIEPVPKGIRGADIVQRVRNERLQDCGMLVWETKNTRNWSPAWIDKLEADQRALGATVAVLISVALPEGIEGFGRIEGVWVAGVRTWPALALALREQLVQVAFARAAFAGKNEKMEMLYQYLAGDEFRQRVEAIVEAFTALQAQVQRERRAMEKHWAEREKHLERVLASTTGMYGALQGIVGGGLPAIAALELDDGPCLLQGGAS